MTHSPSRGFNNNFLSHKDSDLFETESECDRWASKRAISYLKSRDTLSEEAKKRFWSDNEQVGLSGLVIRKMEGLETNREAAGHLDDSDMPLPVKQTSQELSTADTSAKKEREKEIMAKLKAREERAKAIDEEIKAELARRGNLTGPEISKSLSYVSYLEAELAKLKYTEPEATQTVLRLKDSDRETTSPSYGEEGIQGHLMVPSPSPSRSRSHSRSRKQASGHELIYSPGHESFRDFFVVQNSGSPYQSVTSILRMDDTISQIRQCELEKGDALWDVVVLTGPTQSTKSLESKGPMACTMGQYVEKAWPQSAEHIKCMFELLDPHDVEIKGAARTSTVLVQGPYGEVEVVISEQELDGALLTMNGPSGTQADLFQATTWIHAVLQRVALQQGSQQHGPLTSNTHLQIQNQVVRKDGSTKTTYELTTTANEPLSVPDKSSCWKRLFPNTPCAVDFWTDSRPDTMHGVELSFELMCFLAGLQYEVIEEDGIVLYGQRALVYPVMAFDDCIQWHLEDIKPGQTPKPRIAGKKRRFHDLEPLREAKRHFLGMWKDAEILLGTDAIDPTLIGWSGARTVDKVITNDGFAVGGTVALPKVLSFSWTQNFKIARTRKNIYMKNFGANLHQRIRTPVMLYSPSEERGWLVSYTSVLLHIARARAEFQKSLGFSIPVCERRDDGGQAAFDCIYRCRRDPLKQPAVNEQLSEEEKNFTIQDYIDEVVAAMDCAERESSRANGFWRPFQERILGFDMADLAKMKPYMQLKEHKLDPLASGCWAPLLGGVQFTFFCEELPAPIVPARSLDFRGTTCQESLWRKIPKGFNLLTASLPVLAYMTEHLNRGNKLVSLVPQHDWHSPGVLFDHSCGKAGPHTCSRLQSLKPTGQAISPTIRIDQARGAAVFKYATGMTTITNYLGPQNAPSQRQTGSVERDPSRRNRPERLELPSRTRRSDGGSGSDYSSNSSPIPRSSREFQPVPPSISLLPPTPPDTPRSSLENTGRDVNNNRQSTSSINSNSSLSPGPSSRRADPPSPISSEDASGEKYRRRRKRHHHSRDTSQGHSSTSGRSVVEKSESAKIKFGFFH